MKKVLIPTLGLLFFAACTKSNDETGPVTPPPGSTSKIYFDGYSESVGPGGMKWNELYSINTDGSSLQQLTNFSVNGTLGNYSEEPAFNDDGTKIIFTSDKDNDGNNIYSMNADGSGVAKITSNSGEYLYKPSVFQSGTKLLFYKETVPEKFGEIYSANIDGSGQVKLTTPATDGSCREAAVNPANTTIAFSCRAVGSGNYNIFTMALNGSGKTALTTGSLDRSNPRYSPDGTRIVFEGDAAAASNKHSEVFIMNANGSGITQLTNYSSNGTLGTYTAQACFSKDGATIYYVSDESGISQLYKMNLDGSGKTKLTTSAEDKYNPVVKY